MSLTVVLINWRDVEQTIACVRKLRDWTALNPELIVVDNQSRVSTRKALQQHLTPSELICSSDNRGYGGATNLALRRIREDEGKYVLLLNTDATISQTSAAHLLERLKRHPELSIIGPCIVERHGGRDTYLVGGRDIARHSSTKISVERGALMSIEGWPLHHVDHVSGTVFLTRSSVVAEVGLLDEMFFFSGEIADFCARARRSGHESYVDLEVYARHDIEQADTRLRETLYAYYSLRNRFLYAKKHHPRHKLWYFSRLSKICGREFFVALRGRNTGKIRAIFYALAHAVVNRFGNQNDKFKLYKI